MPPPIKKTQIKKKKKPTTGLGPKKVPKKKASVSGKNIKFGKATTCRQYLHPYYCNPFNLVDEESEKESAFLATKQFDDFEESVDNNSSCDEDYSDDGDEGQDAYKPGGYHPVNIGDKFHARYTVIEKLGWGHFSTVWMTYDKKASSSGFPEFIALKVQKSAAHYREAALDEIELLNCAASKAKSEAVGAEFGLDYDPCVVLMYDHFEHNGPNGKHVCMTFEILGENLLKVIKKYEYRGIPIPIVKNFVRQICIGLDFLHRHCSIIHTDLKPENILIGTPPTIPSIEDVRNLLAGTPTKVKTLKKVKQGGQSAIKSESFEKHQDHGKVLSTEQRKKLKKKLKKKRQQARKNETKKRGSRRKGGADKGDTSSADMTAKEMLLMELDSYPVGSSRASTGAVAVSAVSGPTRNLLPTKLSSESLSSTSGLALVQMVNELPSLVSAEKGAGVAIPPLSSTRALSSLKATVQSDRVFVDGQREEDDEAFDLSQRGGPHGPGLTMDDGDVGHYYETDLQREERSSKRMNSLQDLDIGGDDDYNGGEEIEEVSKKYSGSDPNSPGKLKIPVVSLTGFDATEDIAMPSWMRPTMFSFLNFNMENGGSNGRVGTVGGGIGGPIGGQGQAPVETKGLLYDRMMAIPKDMWIPAPRGMLTKLTMVSPNLVEDSNK